jgi:acyl-CoA hydrolase
MEGLTTDKPPEIAATLAAKRGPAEAVFDHFGDGADLIVGLGNGEPATILDAIEARGERLSGVAVHQMLPLRKRRYMHGDFAGLRHVSWFLTPANRQAFHEGTCDLVPNNSSDVPHLMNRSTRRSLALAAASAPDRHGYAWLGPHAEYTAAMIGEVPFFPEVNHKMPRTFGENQVHSSQVTGWSEADYPLFELPSRPTRETDRRIAEYVAERIPDGATLQAGIGAIPNEVLGLRGATGSSGCTRSCSPTGSSTSWSRG